MTRGLLGLLGLVAAAAVAWVVWGYVAPGGVATSLVTLSEVARDVRVVRDGVAREGVVGLEVRAGDTVRVGVDPDARAVVAVDGTPTLELRSESILQLDRVDDSVLAVTLRGGELYRVRPAERALQVSVAREGVTGPEVGALITGGTARVALQDGLVLVENDGGAGTVVTARGVAEVAEIPPGQRLVVPPDGEARLLDRLPADWIPDVPWPEAEAEAAEVVVAGVVRPFATVWIRTAVDAVGPVTADGDGRFELRVPLEDGATTELELRATDLDGAERTARGTVTRRPGAGIQRIELGFGSGGGSR